MPGVSMRQMLEAVSIRTSDPLLEPEDGPYIFGERNRIHIITSRRRSPCTWTLRTS